jgi:hypothetical protein
LVYMVAAYILLFRKISTIRTGEVGLGVPLPAEEPSY